MSGDVPSALTLGAGAATNPASDTVLSIPVISIGSAWESVDIPTLKNWVGSGTTGFLEPPVTAPASTAVATFTGSAYTIETILPGSNGEVLMQTSTGPQWEAIPPNLPALFLEISPTISFSDGATFNTTAPGGLAVTVIGNPGTGTAVCYVSLTLSSWIPSTSNNPMLIYLGGVSLPAVFPQPADNPSCAVTCGVVNQPGDVEGIPSIQMQIGSGTEVNDRLLFVGFTNSTTIYYSAINAAYSGLPLSLSACLSYIC